MWDALRTKNVARVTQRILVFLGPMRVISRWRRNREMSEKSNLRIARAVGAANVTALVACLDASSEDGLALVACSPHALAGLLVHQVLASRLARLLEGDLLLFDAVIGNDGGIFLLCFDKGSSLFAAGNPLFLGSLSRVAAALCAADMLAVRALLGGTEGRVALVASSANAHADRLVHAQNSVIRSRSLPFVDRELEAESLTKLLGALLEQLGFGELGHTLHRFVPCPSLLSLGQWGARI
jgi:hypothetical protein